MTRKALAERSGVSERFLAQVESGLGNGSVLILREVARALDLPLDLLLADPDEHPSAYLKTMEQLRHLGSDEVARVQRFIASEFGRKTSTSRQRRIALIGLRGAGKSTAGTLLAKELDCPFIELDRLVEQSSGISLPMIFDLYGQAGFRRFELLALQQVLEQYPEFVIAAGGSIVSDRATYDSLLRECFTVWLRSTPELHMDRVIAQGDMRPIAQSAEAMTDLRRILSEREPLYAKADLTVDTSAADPEHTAQAIAAVVRTA